MLRRAPSNGTAAERLASPIENRAAIQSKRKSGCCARRSDVFSLTLNSLLSASGPATQNGERPRNHAGCGRLWFRHE
jgi:hypothetical protein